MHALKINRFIRREQQLSFYANGTTSPVQSRPYREREHSIDCYLQCFNNRETVMSTVESEHDKKYAPSKLLYIISLGIRSLISLRRPSEEGLDPWLIIKRTAKNPIRLG